MKPRILLVVTSGNVGGAQQCVLEIARGMRERGYPVTVASGTGGWLVDEAEALGCATHLFRHLRRSSNQLAVIGFMGELYAYLRKHPHEVVHLNSSNTLPGALGARVLGARVVFTAHGLSMLDEGYDLTPVLRPAYLAWFFLWFRFVHVVACVSTRNADRLRQLRLVSRRKLRVIPNGIDSSAIGFIRRDEARARLHAEAEELAVVVLGRLQHAKRQELLIRAWRTVLEREPRARLTLVGDGPDREALQALVLAQGLAGKVRLVGEIPFGSRLLTGADILALPSRYEGWPMVLLEALAAGVPIVASDVGGIREQVGDAGVLMPREADVAAWANVIASLLADQARRENLAAKARGRAALWSADRMVDAYEKSFRAKP